MARGGQLIQNIVAIKPGLDQALQGVLAFLIHPSQADEETILDNLPKCTPTLQKRLDSFRELKAQVS